MFTLIAKIIDHFAGDEDENQEISENLRRNLPIFEEKKEVCNRRQFEGEITNVFNCQGLVDHEIYFSFDNVVGGKKTRIKDRVSGIAYQVKENGGWLVETIMIDSVTWQNEIAVKANLTSSVYEKQLSASIGKIVSLDKGEGWINDNIAFNVEDCCLGDYLPFVGDWVRTDVITNASGKITADSIEPLRSMTLEGEITAIFTDHGYINGEIYFTPEACLNTYKPTKWDPVKLIAIESEQGKCSWRATFVAPRSKDVRSLKTRNKAATTVGGWVVPGQRPQVKGRKKILPEKLQHYPVPNSLRDCVMDNGEITFVVPELIEALDMDNYVHRFSALLHLEEIQFEIDIREYDLSRVCLRPAGEYLALAVPGLAEGRPSVLTGDKIILSDPSDPDGPCYEGFIHEVLSKEVWLKFNYEFHSNYNGEDYNVEFTFNRTSLRRCHQAVSLAVKQLGTNLLFPSNITMKPPQINIEQLVYNMEVVPLETTYINSPKPQTTNNNKQPTSHTTYADVDRVKLLLDFCDFNLRKDDNLPSVDNSVKKSPSSLEKKIKKYLPNINPWIQDKIEFLNPKLNDCQKVAVINIVLGQCRPLPYIIFGPPGTGKTITIVESILQILIRIPSSRIVACTPSNSAADLLIERLFASGRVKVCDMVRLNSFHRKEESIPDLVLRFSSSGEDLPIISRYRIVVCTCNTAGSMFNLGLKIGHFTHVFVDEAGQATEPECLIPVGLVSGADGQIILAGDPKQLGQVLMSQYSKLYGLELSFLERLMNRSIYSHSDKRFEEYGGFDNDLVTMLKDNYRSHSAILQLPSKLFYFNKLEVKADMAFTHSLINWSKLPTKGFPVIFHGTRGEDMREGNSPSWFNPSEVVLVVQYLQSLIKDTSLNIDVDDIGIITPYRKQIEKIRLFIEKLGIEKVKVGSVEEFQGQERQVIIISTVRSNERLLGFDFRHVLGFLSNPKRFNVAITRAEAALVIIGNPHVLAQDDCWRQLIQYCVDNGGYTGCELPNLSEVQDIKTTDNGTLEIVQNGS